MRNWIEHGVATERDPSATSLIDLIESVGHTLSGWLIPLHWPDDIGVALLGILFTLLVYYAYTEISSKQSDARKEAIIYLAPYVLFFFLYVSFISITASVFAIDYNLHDRLLSPVYIPFFILVFFVLDRIVSSAKTIGSARLIKSLLTILFCVWVIGYPGRQLYGAIDNRVRTGAGGFATDNWRNDKLVKYLIENDLDGKTFSNGPNAIYFFTNRPATLTPMRHGYRSPGKSKGDTILDLVKAKDAYGKVYLVWFKKIGLRHIYPLSAIAGQIDLKLVHLNSDGFVFEIVGARTFGSPPRSR
jgi:hypothetical protein